MKGVDIVEPYLNSIGIRFLAGDKNDYSATTIFLLHDMVYQIVTKKISKIRCTHEAKKARNNWVELVRNQFGRFWMQIQGDRQDIICELMDDFESYTNNQREIFKCKIMDAVSFMSDDDCRNYTDVQLASAYAQMAKRLWERIVDERFRDSSHLAYDEGSIHYAKVIMRDIGNRYDINLDFNVLKPVQDASDYLATRIVSFIESKTDSNE